VDFCIRTHYTPYPMATTKEHEKEGGSAAPPDWGTAKKRAKKRPRLPSPLRSLSQDAESTTLLEQEQTRLALFQEGYSRLRWKDDVRKHAPVDDDDSDKENKQPRPTVPITPEETKRQLALAQQKAQCEPPPIGALAERCIQQAILEDHDMLSGYRLYGSNAIGPVCNYLQLPQTERVCFLAIQRFKEALSEFCCGQADRFPWPPCYCGRSKRTDSNMKDPTRRYSIPVVVRVSKVIREQMVLADTQALRLRRFVLLDTLAVTGRIFAVDSKPEETKMIITVEDYPPVLSKIFPVAPDLTGKGDWDHPRDQLHFPHVRGSSGDRPVPGIIPIPRIPRPESRRKFWLAYDHKHHASNTYRVFHTFVELKTPMIEGWVRHTLGGVITVGAIFVLIGQYASVIREALEWAEQAAHAPSDAHRVMV